ncbi:MAG: putative teichuronic acid biosynthesis glycosyltransferase TuaC [Verrucomicrobia bacterium ADurb.Bin345]|nr:MAG: putative teichuronic acid biosynthesis glycosyltransferase TuaC [Verrucomicrobia bacterium ADurb.Bin345]
MRVTILVPDISSNILWAATALGLSLASRFDVEIVGPDFGGGICEMYRDAFPYVAVPAKRLYRLPDFLWERRRLIKAVTGDVVIAVKAYADTLPIALHAKRSKRAKAVVYLDEWDAANFMALPVRDRIRSWLRHAHHPLEDNYFPLVERMIPAADAVICTSTSLARRFRGSVIPIGVDTEVYCPQDPEQTRELKRALGMAEDRLIVFGGVARPHKGLEEIVEALATLGDESIRLLVVGPQTEFLQKLQRVDRYAPYIVCIGAKPKKDMPAFLALGDLVVLPQRNTLLAQSQVPCKIFEAMAMAKPVIASDVSDLADILKDCGWVVPPDNIPALAKAIAHAMAHPNEGEEFGRRAREKCVREYDRRVTAEKLVKVVEALADERIRE